MTENETRSLLQDAFLVDFPEDLFLFWEFARSFGHDKSLNTFREPMGLFLDGPFKLLAGELEPAAGWHLNARYYDDPPEFFTIFSGDTDGHHWGYWFDDPDNTALFSVAQYYSKDAFEVTEDGKTLFEAFRLHPERCYQSTLENIETDPEVEEHWDEYEAEREAYAPIRCQLMQFATADRPEIGVEYEDRYAESGGQRKTTAETLEGMGIIVPENLYRPLSINPEKLREIVISNGDLTATLLEANQTLLEGYPGTALELGRNLWIGNPVQKQESYRLLEIAYTALKRPSLAKILVKIVPTRVE